MINNGTAIRSSPIEISFDGSGDAGQGAGERNADNHWAHTWDRVFKTWREMAHLGIRTDAGETAELGLRVAKSTVQEFTGSNQAGVGHIPPQSLP